LIKSFSFSLCLNAACPGATTTQRIYHHQAIKRHASTPENLAHFAPSLMENSAIIAPGRATTHRMVGDPKKAAIGTSQCI
jgi:hypothetical protein